MIMFNGEPIGKDKTHTHLELRSLMKWVRNACVESRHTLDGWMNYNDSLDNGCMLSSCAVFFVKDKRGYPSLLFRSHALEGERSLAIRINRFNSTRGDVLIHEVLDLFCGNTTIKKLGGGKMFRSIRGKKEGEAEWNRPPYRREKQYECNF